MEGGMNFTKIVYAAALYSVWVILIGYFVPELESYAAMIAALGAGVYAGYGCGKTDGTANGFIAGLLGGLVTGIASFNIGSIAGIPISVSVADFLVPVFSAFSSSPEVFSFASLTIIGLFFGSVGGFLGSIRHLKPVFLFSTMFLLFILLGAVDNAAWNLSTPGWTWNMSFSHVLTNQVDIVVAVVFALIVTIVTYLLRLFK
jgi:hypothetical protein